MPCPYTNLIQSRRWNTYNHYSCSPNETIVQSNAQALVDLGLSSLGYRYVTTDCGWTVADRLPDGSLTWNETLFPQGFPAMGDFLHDLGLLFGVYQDSGILLCGSPPNETGSLCMPTIMDRRECGLLIARRRPRRTRCQNIFLVECGLSQMYVHRNALGDTL